MASYISVVFEKAQLVTSEQVRVIVRNRDDGNVPPNPSTSYYPTYPDDLQPFIVGLFINSVTGESFARIATVADLAGITIRTLDTLVDTGVDFVAAGVAIGDLIEVTLPDSELWTSDEYPDINPHIFQVATIVNSTTITVTRPFPAHANSLNWAIPARSLIGAAGVTLRNGLPANGTEFLTTRFNRLYPTVVEAETSVVAMKADIGALMNENAGASLVSETVTIGSTL